jgi:protein involved in sex pheromone biosynthesis
MRKLLVALLLSVVLLSGCSTKLYEMSNVTVTEKSKEQTSGCRSICYDYFAQVEKDGNTYRFKIDADSYTLVDKGAVVDLEVFDTTLDGKQARMTPVGVKEVRR